MELNVWQKHISSWYESQRLDQIEPLEALLYQAPDTVFGPKLTGQQSKAIACWLDGCLRVYEHTKYHQQEKAYRILIYASAKLERAVYEHNCDIEIRRWCIKRLRHLTVLALEFCNQQHDQKKWQQHAHDLIESHMAFMQTLNWNGIGKHDHGVMH
ncbi:hypothetical protein [Vibrio mytili]|uniref:Transcriptional regulator n=1 Tax=Vibrio mytili TaxID=50718 RepID=A0A0C3HSU7_9VIBR|nr:hypothetical protein [Vibrio mytili]KIN11256.1 transcriptional regulator [Vibrio mytili]